MPKRFPLFQIAAAVLKETFLRIQRAQLMMAASGLAYTTLLSMIPILALSFAIFQSVGGLESVYEKMEPLILSSLTEGSSREVIQTLRGFIRSTHSDLVGFSGLFGLTLTTASTLYSVEKAINQAWEITPKRSLWKRLLAYSIFILLGPIALSIGLGLTSSLGQPFWHLLPSGTGGLLVETLLFFLIYQWVPQSNVLWPYSLASAFLTSSLSRLARSGYSYYILHYVPYHRIYGALATLPITLLWIYVLWVILLSGAALTAVLQKRLGSR